MIHSHNPLGVYKPASRPQTAPYKGENRRLMREDWAAFCTESCPHPGRSCDRGTCREFKAKFGTRKDV